MGENIWNYPSAAGHTPDTDLTGYKVEAMDGSIGKVDKHSQDVGDQYIVVDTGMWIFGKEVLLPAGTITGIDAEAKTINVARSKEQIKSAPEFDKDKHLGNTEYHQELGTHYSSGAGSGITSPTPPGTPGNLGDGPGRS
ncbi:PRC-barrel domain-containing protein [Streptomyces longispororuber]|uniref:PRC-barrel domain-containing protein n=1 Tax=Streptomyces longispororuber TaxID=68230 RepID=UPI00210B9406|nr:PRC-barrel domain-containing protein [Streptomyces longispororuber]MCQ4209961.1 PRC-barrel domain-containing protein [Streptomyces longispororuber]